MIPKQENKERIQEKLSEIKTALRLLPQDRRSTLMDFIVQEREHGVSYITDHMMRALTGAFIIYEPIDGISAQQKPLLNDMFVEDDLRQLVDMSDRYPLYLECFIGRTDDVFNKIQNCAKVLYSLNETDMSAFAHEVCAPDTPEETAQKAKRHSEVEKKAHDWHYKKYKTNKYYKAMIDYCDGPTDGQSVQAEKPSLAGKNALRMFVALSVCGTFGVAIYSVNQNKQEKTPEQSTPQVQKITDQKKMPSQDTSRGARTE